MGNLPLDILLPPHDRRIKAHMRSNSTPKVTVNPHKRKGPAPHQLLRINTRNLHLVASPVVDLTRLDSPSIASFTPYSIESQASASGSLRAHMHVCSQSLFSTSKRAEYPDIGVAAIGMPTSRQRPGLFSLFEFSSTGAYRPPSPIALDAGEPFSSSPPSSLSLSIPSISRTHSTAASSSLPRTPPLPLPPLFAHRKKKHRESMPGYEGRKRAPSSPMPPSHRKLDHSPSRDLVRRERTFSTFNRSHTRLERRTTRSRSPGRTPDTQGSNSPSSPLSLAALEGYSKFMRTVTVCAVCGSSGPGYPRCPGCGDAWCSRACRMAAKKEAGGGEGIRGHGCKGKRTVRG